MHGAGRVNTHNYIMQTRISRISNLEFESFNAKLTISLTYPILGESLLTCERLTEVVRAFQILIIVS